MIDTLRINLADAEIKRSSPIQLQPPIIDQSTGKSVNECDLYIDNSGKIVTGAKAFLNDEKFNLTINPSIESELNDETGKNNIKAKRFKRIHTEDQFSLYDYNYREEEQVTGIFIQTSLPRLIKKNNFKNLTLDEQVKAINFLQDRLRSFGIITDLKKAKLSRVDTFTNIKTDHIFYAYSNLFNLMECSRMKSVGWGAESFLWKNGQHELMIYDKPKEMKAKDPGVRLGRIKNIMRIENRLLRKRKIETSLKLETVEDLLDNNKKVKEYHTKEVGKKIFRYTYNDIEEMTELDLRDKFIRAQKIYGNRWFDRYCYNFGVWTVSKICDIDFISDLIEEIDKGSPAQQRTKKSRILKSINEAKINFGTGGAFSDDFINFKSNVELYNEIKQKFYKEVA